MKIKLWISSHMKNTKITKFACLYLSKCERDKQKTEIDCQIYKKINKKKPKKILKKRKIYDESLIDAFFIPRTKSVRW